MTAADTALAVAQLQLGDPYVFADEGPDSFDCSGLTLYSYAQAGIKLPRTAREQQAWALPVAKPLPGDLVFYGRPATHVGLYLGDGKMISAPRPGGVVHIGGVGTPTSYGRVRGAGTAAAPALGVVTDAAGWVGDTVSGWLGGARHVVIEGTFVVLGLVLVGYGVFRAVAAPVRGKVQSIVEGK